MVSLVQGGSRGMEGLRRQVRKPAEGAQGFCPVSGRQGPAAGQKSVRVYAGLLRISSVAGSRYSRGLPSGGCFSGLTWIWSFSGESCRIAVKKSS